MGARSNGASGGMGRSAGGASLPLKVSASETKEAIRTLRNHVISPLQLNKEMSEYYFYEWGMTKTIKDNVKSLEIKGELHKMIDKAGFSKYKTGVFHGLVDKSLK